MNDEQTSQTEKLCPVCKEIFDQHSDEQREACKEAFLADLRKMTEQMQLATYVGMDHGEPPIIVLDLTKFEHEHDGSLVRFRYSCGTNHLIEMCKFSKYGIELRNQVEGCFHCKPAAGPFNISWQEIEDAVKTGKDYEKTTFGRTQVRITQENLLKLLDSKSSSIGNSPKS